MDESSDYLTLAIGLVILNGITTLVVLKSLALSSRQKTFQIILTWVFPLFAILVLLINKSGHSSAPSDYMGQSIDGAPISPHDFQTFHTSFDSYDSSDSSGDSGDSGGD